MLNWPLEEYNTVETFPYPNLGLARSKVFVSYAHRDKRFFDSLQVHLNFATNLGLEIWSDRRINVGERWRDKIKLAIAESKVAILLISASFLTSRFIREDELPPILEAERNRGLRIVCIIISDCAFADTQLAEYQAINDPNHPVCEMRFGKKERVWNSVLKTVLEDFSLG